MMLLLGLLAGVGLATTRSSVPRTSRWALASAAGVGLAGTVLCVAPFLRQFESPGVRLTVAPFNSAFGPLLSAQGLVLILLAGVVIGTARRRTSRTGIAGSAETSLPRARRAWVTLPFMLCALAALTGGLATRSASVALLVALWTALATAWWRRPRAVTRMLHFSMGDLVPALFLLLLPMTLWVLFASRKEEPGKKYALISIGCFTVLSYAAWTVRVVNTSALWQARYLFPAVMVFAIPTALAWDSLHQLDTTRLRVSFLFDTLITLVILLTVVDNAVFVIQINPLAVALGAQSRERYIERVNPSYTALIAAMDELPADVHVYSLFEPRTYVLPRPTQPDVIISNFAHDA